MDIRRETSLKTIGFLALVLSCASSRPATAASARYLVFEIGADGMIVACGSGAVQIVVLHPAGKRRISPMEWARGRK